jgi:hypothetical protein
MNTNKFIYPASSLLLTSGLCFATYSGDIGGYYVVYEDGYKSFSPASAFENGYTRL